MKLKKLIALMLGAAMLLALGGCTRKEEAPAEEHTAARTLEEAVEKAGFGMTASDGMMTFPGEIAYDVWPGKMIQVKYGDERILYARKALTSADILPDLGDASETSVKDIAGYEVTQWDIDGQTRQLTWQDGDYTMCIRAPEGFDPWEVYELMRAMMDVEPFTPRLTDMKDGWELVTDRRYEGEIKEIYEKAEPLDGVGYTPLLLLAKKSGDEGDRYCLLTRAQVIYPDSKPYFALMYLLKDRDGNVTITDIRKVGEGENGLLGGWQTTEDGRLTEEVTKLFNDAMEGTIGVSYEPVAYLASQLVSGTNHCFLARITGVYPTARPAYSLIYIYQDLSGNLEVQRYEEVPIR